MTTNMTFSPAGRLQTKKVTIPRVAQGANLLLLALGVSVLFMEELPVASLLLMLLLTCGAAYLDTRQSCAALSFYRVETWTRAFVVSSFGYRWCIQSSESSINICIVLCCYWILAMCYLNASNLAVPTWFKKRPRLLINCIMLFFCMASAMSMLKTFLLAVNPIYVAVIISALLCSTIVFWRHLLWTHPQQKASKEQNKTVWSKLATSKSPSDFWSDVHGYSQTHGGLPEILPHLSLQVLLSFFAMESSEASTHVDLRENIKTAINEKEPRAVFVWELYNDRRAAEVIGDLDAYLAATKNDAIDLPTL